MSDVSQLLIGITAFVVSSGILFACLPRDGKTSGLARAPFIAPALSVIIVGGLVFGLILIASYFTAIDNATLSGKSAGLHGAALAWRA